MLILKMEEYDYVDAGLGRESDLEGLDLIGKSPSSNVVKSPSQIRS